MAAQRKRKATHGKTAQRKTAHRKTTRRKTTSRTRARGNAARKSAGGRRWSSRVTRTSDALDLDRGVFALNDPKKIAASLKRSAERSRRRKSDPYRSAMSMLTFYINRAGRALPARRKRKLEQAKEDLRAMFRKN